MNLIICTTPLHSLIAEKSIEKRAGEFFHLIFISERGSNKDYFYFNRLSNKVNNADFFCVYYKNRVEYLKFLFRIKKFLNKKYDDVFFANINSIFIHRILSLIYFSKIITFDDGMANIIPNSSITCKENISFIRILLNYVFGIKFNKRRIKNIISSHYTLFPDFKNISDKITPLSLGNSENIHVKNCNRKKIFVGQPIFEMLSIGKEKYIKIIRDICNLLQIDYYIPHPRENYKISGVNYIETDLILEDYILNEDGCFELYSFYSSSLLTLINCQNISLNSVFVKGIGMEKNNAIMGSYSVIEKLGLKIIYIENHL